MSCIPYWYFIILLATPGCDDECVPDQFCASPKLADNWALFFPSGADEVAAQPSRSKILQGCRVAVHA
jgi:hypothetical protein